MHGCEGYEIQLEMQRHDGTLDAASLAELERHLSTCEDCQRYAALAQEMENVMQTTAQHEAGRVDWTALRGRVDAWRRGVERVPWWVLASCLIMTPLAIWAYPGQAWMMGVLMPALGVLMFLGLRRQARRTVEEAHVAEGELFEFWRKTLKRNLASLPWSALALILAGVLVGGELLLRPTWGAEPAATGDTLFVGCLSVFCIVSGIYALTVVRRRLKKELAEVQERDGLVPRA